MAVFTHRILNHRNIYLGGLSLLIFSLPVSPFGISLGTFILLGNWLLEGDFREKKKRALSRPGLLIFSSIFLLCLAGLLNTSNLSFGWHDIVIKVPLLVLPVLIATSSPLNTKEFKVVTAALLAGLWTASLAGVLALAGILPVTIQDIREIALFISHIRLALLTGLTLHILLYLLLYIRTLHRVEKILYVVSLGWFVFFLFLLKSGTSFLMLGLFLLAAFIILIKKSRNFMLKYFIIILGITGVLLSATWFTHALARYYAKDPLPVQSETGVTMNGNPYDPPQNLAETENGHYIWLHVCEKELRRAWNSHSSLDYDGRDREGQELRMTLLRYMTSLDYRKDSAGFSRMTPADIRNVENGMTNYLFANRLALYPSLYQILWEMDQYKKGKLSGHSHVQRAEYLKTGWQIVRDHFWCGVGTGDVPDMFRFYYEKNHSSLAAGWRLRAHNQYLTYWITYGIFGFLYFLFAFFSPFFLEKKQHDYLALIFMIIAALSMLYEDTLETQAGVYFIAFFYSLLIFATKRNNPSSL